MHPFMYKSIFVTTVVKSILKISLQLFLKIEAIALGNPTI